MGKLDNIIQRNRKRKLGGERIAVGMTSLIVLIVVILLIITLLRPAPVAPPAPPEPVRIPVQLYRAPTKKKPPVQPAPAPAPRP